LADATLPEVEPRRPATCNRRQSARHFFYEVVTPARPASPVLQVAAGSPMSGAEAGDRWLWPDELDALVAAPAHHFLLLENERVRVIETKIAAGETTAIHTHRWPNVQYILKSTEFLRRDGEGSLLFDTRTADGLRPEPWTARWSKPLPPHSIENVGETELHVVTVELKDRPAGGDRAS